MPDPGQEPHETDIFRIEKTVDTWADVAPSSASSPNQHRHILVGLDTYSIVDLVSISFVKSLGLSPCSRSKHQHTVPDLEGVGRTGQKRMDFTIFGCEFTTAGTIYSNSSDPP